MRCFSMQLMNNELMMTYEYEHAFMYFTFNRNSNDIVEDAELLERNEAMWKSKRVHNHKMENE